MKPTEIVDALHPIVAWRRKMTAWDGGCALPPQPKEWEWARLFDVFDRLEADSRDRSGTDSSDTAALHGHHGQRAADDSES